MAKIHRQALLAYPADQVFAIIQDVPSYPEFLRWCVDAHVLEHTENSMLAGLTVSIAGFRQRFTTRNIATLIKDDADRSVHVLALKLEEGPFQYLSGQWSVTNLAEAASRIELQLDFAFQTGFVEAAFSRGFGQIAQQLVADFVRRAHAKLGNR